MSRRGKFDAEAIARDLYENSHRIQHSEISYDEFTARQRGLWAKVERGKLPIVGTPCARRHEQVMKALRDLIG